MPISTNVPSMNSAPIAAIKVLGTTRKRLKKTILKYCHWRIYLKV